MNKGDVEKIRFGKSSLDAMRKFLAALFEKSIAASLAGGIRRTFLRLRTRVIGIFFASFGAYTVLFTLIQRLFLERATEDGGIYFALCLALASIPLIVKDTTLSRALTESRAGNVVCDFLGIRRETLRATEKAGRSAAGFILGAILAGTVFFAPPHYTFCALIMLVLLGIILSVPEAGLILSVACLLFCSYELQCALLGATVVSYIIKLLRGKRSLNLRRSDALVAVFALCIIGGYLVSPYRADLGSMALHLLFTGVYFLAILLLRDCKRIKLLCTTAAVSFGAAAALYIFAYALSRFAASFPGLDLSFLLTSLNSFFGEPFGEVRLIFTAVLPLCVGLALRHYDTISRFTLWLCAISIGVCLGVMGAYACLCAALVAVVIMLLVTGRRTVYLSLTIILCALVALMYIDPLGGRVYRYIFSGVTEAFSQVETLLLDGGMIFSTSLVCGGGMYPIEELQSFYLYTISSLGLIGLVLLVIVIIMCAREFSRLLWQTLSTGATRQELRRFGAIRSAADTRLTAASPFAAVVSILLSASFANLWEQENVYMLLWLCLGAGVAYSRCALREMEKAENASAAMQSRDAATIDLK